MSTKSCLSLKTFMKSNVMHTHNILWRHYREYNYHNKSLFSSARTSNYPVYSFIVMLNIIRTKATMSALQKRKQTC